MYHLASPTAAHWTKLLDERNKKVGRLLFSTRDGTALDTYRSKIADSIETLSVFECTFNGNPYVVAGLGGPWYVPTQHNTYAAYSRAALFDDVQAHLPAAGNLHHIYLDGSYGPTWGDGHALVSFYNNSLDTFYCKVATAYPTWAAKPGITCQHMYIYAVNDGCAQKMDDDFTSFVGKSIDTIVTEELGALPHVVIGIAAVANSGKSTFFNCATSVLRGQRVMRFNAGGGAGVGGQRTRRAQCADLFECARKSHSQSKKVYLRDTEGTDQVTVLQAHLQGLLEEGEEFDNAQLADYFIRKKGPMQAAHVVILLIDQERLCGPAIDETTERFVRSLLELQKNYNANKGDKIKRPFTIIPVITKVDVWCAHPSRRLSDRSALLRRTHGPLEPLFDRLTKAPFHFQPSQCYAFGWADRDDFSITDPNEPVVIALKRILGAAIDAAAYYVESNRLHQ